MGNLTTEIEAFFSDLQALVQVIAPVIAFLGFVGLGLMYLGSSIPILADWKRNNPQAASQVVTGLIFVLLASSIASFISFTQMVAEIKSHVLRRDEKGLLGIPFKRWLLSGVTGGMAFAITGIVLSGLGIPIGAGVALGVLILSGPRQGLPLWERLLYQARGALVVQAARQPTDLAARLATWLDIPVQSITRLDGDRLFADPTPAEAGDLSEWVSRVRADDDDLIIVDRPFASSERSI